MRVLLPIVHIFFLFQIIVKAMQLHDKLHMSRLKICTLIKNKRILLITKSSSKVSKYM